MYRRGNSGGSWLPEEKKANMWHGRGTSGGSWPPALPRSLESIPRGTPEASRAETPGGQIILL